LLPVTRFIIQASAQKYSITVTEIKLKGQYHFENAKENFLATCVTSAKLNHQSLSTKVIKYIRLFYYLISAFWETQSFIYTPDHQVVFIASLLKKIGLISRKAVIIYHQFELIESNRNSGLNKWIWSYLLKHASSLIGLAIFPEVNRLEYFVNEADFATDKTLLFPNSTIIAAETESKVLLEIPPGAKVIGHIGNVGPDHYIHQYIALVNSFQNDADIYFLMVGRYSPVVLSLLKGISNERFVLVGEVPHSDLNSFYQRINYGLILYKGVNKNFEYCAPNKLYEYLSYGISVFAHRLKGLSSLNIPDEIMCLSDFEAENLALRVKEFIHNNGHNRFKVKTFFKDNLDLNSYIAVLFNRLAETENVG